MGSLHCLTDSEIMGNRTAEKENAEKIVRLDGHRTILVALSRWAPLFDGHSSAEFCSLAISALVDISNNVKKVSRSIVNIGLQTILEAAKKHKNNKCVSNNTVALLGNLALFDKYKSTNDVATEECIDIVMKTMKKLPADKFAQFAGCRYSQNIFSQMASKNVSKTNKFVPWCQKLLIGFVPQTKRFVELIFVEWQKKLSTCMHDVFRHNYCYHVWTLRWIHSFIHSFHLALQSLFLWVCCHKFNAQNFRFCGQFSTE